MVDYQAIFDEYCRENGLALHMCFEMPEGFEGADGMFDPDSRTVYINTDFPEGTPDFVRAFFLFMSCGTRHSTCARNGSAN